MSDATPLSSAPGSPLSSLGSSNADYDEMEQEIMEPSARPAKRLKLGDNASMRATPVSHHPEVYSGSISSDSSGDVPNEPGNQRPEDDDPVHEQVTICQWVGCEAGDQGNMDKLVDHIHNEHIETRQRKYTCEWSDCQRRSMPHASGYALKAHMRSHTREKPFYCALPECDRAFTRSDALAKHMRTVHETEALRPSDPVPKSMQPANKGAKLKLTIKAPQAAASQSVLTETTTNGKSNNGSSRFPPELGITAEEEKLDIEELWRLLRKQVHWAEEDSEALKREVEVMEEIRKKEWKEKEVLLDQVVKNELDWHERRQEALAGMPKVMSAEEIRAQTHEQMKQKMEGDEEMLDGPVESAPEPIEK
ncbi:hypothetical protein BP5796_07970 [Coleophoma crateriformis]|uniref:C2H2-type domain-containing protein n=1 Tax=Coleophoma crateriformis TaxID=565419 RepID=A0A3D8RDB4_9HELO|nr:hypothetical protein BP5796_07970 [Coleophoma crateriformis]